jgi:hypothetical protein
MTGWLTAVARTVLFPNTVTAVLVKTVETGAEIALVATGAHVVRRALRKKRRR